MPSGQKLYTDPFVYSIHTDPFIYSSHTNPFIYSIHTDPFIPLVNIMLCIDITLALPVRLPYEPQRLTRNTSIRCTVRPTVWNVFSEYKTSRSLTKFKNLPKSYLFRWAYFH